MQFNYISNEEVSYQNFDLFFGGSTPVNFLLELIS